MLRATCLFVAMLAAAAAPSRTVIAAEALQPAGSPPAVTPAPALAPVPAAVPPHAPEIGLGSLQLVVGYGAEIGSFFALVALGFQPKDLPIDSDYALVAYAGTLMPAMAGAAVCGTGFLSRSYRGRCSTTFVGAYVGAALGVFLGFAMAPSPGQDDTVAFVRSMSALGGIALLTPIGAVIGYHAGKREIPYERASAPAAPALDDGPLFATPAPEPRRAALPAPRLMLPILSASW